MSDSIFDYDLFVIGPGPGGEGAAMQASKGGMRVGVSARLVKTALAQMAAEHPGRTLERIEELWAGLSPPYTPLFEWLVGGEEPDVDLSLALRPVMLANPLDEDRLTDMDPADYVAEWKWDGIRVQASATPNGRALYTRTGDEISQSFPDVIESMTWEGTVDGELLVVRDGQVAPFADLQKRLGRKRVGAKTLRDAPVRFVAYDLLEYDGADIRQWPQHRRRAQLEALLNGKAAFGVSELVDAVSWEGLAAQREESRARRVEGQLIGLEVQAR